MEQILITTLQVEDLQNLIKESIRQVFNENIEEKNKPEEKEEILTTEDIQKMFKVSKVTIHKWKKKGILPYYKMGRRVYFKKSEIFGLLEVKRRKLEF